MLREVQVLTIVVLSVGQVVLHVCTLEAPLLGECRVGPRQHHDTKHEQELEGLQSGCDSFHPRNLKFLS